MARSIDPTTKSSILQLFPLLSSHDPPTRLDASLSLLSSLPLDASPSATPTEDADTPYAIKRLVTGLGSSNEASRQGFAVALTELLARLPADKAASVLPLVISTSTPNAGADAREERDLLFARLLGLHAVIRSRVVLRAGSTNGESFKEVVLALLALSGKKSWIREPAYWVLIEAVRNLLELQGEEDVPEWRDDIIKWAVQRLLNDSREKARGFGPEKIALVLVLQTHAVEADFAAVLAPTFPTGNPLARSSLVSLAQALKGSVGEVEAPSAAASAKGGPKMGSNAVKTSKGGSPLPGAAPHFVWNQIFDLYFPEQGTTPAAAPAGLESRAKWADVWRVLVDQSLFAPTSLPLKATGFALLSLAIQRLPPADVPALFGEGVMRTFTNHLRKSADGEKTLTRVAEKVAASLPPFLAANPSVSFPLLKALVGPPHGSPAFDHRTVEKVVAKLDPKGVRGWVKYLKDFVLGEQEDTIEDGATAEEQIVEDEKAVTARRLWAFDQILHLVKAGGVPKDDETLAGILEFFAVLGWFEVRKSGKGARSYIPVPASTDALQMAARSRFFSILTALPTTPSPSGQTWLSRALALLDNLFADTKHFTAIAETDADVVESRKDVRTIYTQLAAAAGEEDERKKTARCLIEGVLLLSYDEGEEASEALDQLKDCVPALFPKLLTARAAATADAEDEEMNGEDDEEPEPATVLVDLLLELLHRPSAFVKSVSQTVFTGFAGEIGEQAMELLLEQIRPEEADVVEEGEDGDVSMATGDAKVTPAHTHEPKASTSKASNGKAPAEAASDSEDSADDSDDDSDNDAQVDEAFRNELLAALQANGVADEFDAAEEAREGEDEDDADDELLDDDQMMALDDKLADIFRLQGGGNKGKKVERTDDLHYRLRVVDLFESLAKQRVPNPLLVFIVVPLFNIVRSSLAVDKELQAKAAKLLRQIVGVRKDAPAPEDAQAALDALAELHTVAQTVDAADLAALCSQTSVYLVKAALGSPAADARTAATIAQLYGASFKLYLSKKNSKTRMQPLLTVEFCRRAPACAWPLFAEVVGLAGGEGSAVNAYRRMQAFDVAHALLTSYAALKTDASKAQILAAMPAYRGAIYSVLSSAATDATSPFDAARLKEVTKLGLAAVRTTVAVSDAARAQAVWRANEFAEVAEGLKKSERYKGAVAIQGLLRQLVALVGGPEAKSEKSGAGKRKNEEAKDEPKGKKAKKEKKGKKEVEVEVEVEVEEEEEEAEAGGEEVVGEAAVKVGKKDKKKKKEKKREKGKKETPA